MKGSTTGATKRERTPQAERRRITRTKLLDATIESLIEVGYHRTTTVEVGERARVSRGAQLHHFPSKADLLIASVEHLGQERSKEFDAQLAARLQRGDDPIDVAVDILWAMFSDPLYWAVIELMIAARTDPELLEKVEDFEERIAESIRRDFVKLFGPQRRQAKLAVEMTVFFMRGLAMERIFRQNDARYAALVERWKKSLRQALR